VPNEFIDESGKHNKHAQAYYGLFKHLFDPSLLEENGLDKDTLVSFAYAIDDVVDKAVAINSLNPSQMEKDIKVGLLKLLFKAIGTDNAKKLSDEVIRITRHGISRSH
jgi:type I restriction enzyme R subunit